MSTTRKTRQQLDDMIPHVRYEALRLAEFIIIGNKWCATLPDPLARFTAESILESGLVHVRCVFEFLTSNPQSKQICARDYIEQWDWRATPTLNREVGHVHSRLAHLGLVRSDVSTHGAFSWTEWLTAEAPPLLQKFREFTVHLGAESRPTYEALVQPTTAAENLLDVIDEAIPTTE